jgi:hypothetical protein
MGSLPMGRRLLRLTRQAGQQLTIGALIACHALLMRRESYALQVNF